MMLKKIKKKSNAKVNEEKNLGGKDFLKSSWFTKGFEIARKVRNTLEKEREAKISDFVYEFFLKDGEESIIRFLDNESVNIWQHRVLINNKVQNLTCLNPDNNPNLSECILCKKGVKKSYVHIFPIIEREREWTNKKGEKKKDKNIFKIYRVGSRVFGTLEKIRAKRGNLTKFDIEILRTGQGQDSNYNLLPLPDSPLNIPPDKKQKIEEFDLLEYLKPKTPEEINLLLYGSSGVDLSEEGFVESFDNENQFAKDDYKLISEF